ncbi:MAG TPA: sialidase family protein [Streptosporangiaceae bacterium]|nr:sialidase family protein [Streptosporangiaceae bacterium]
MRRRLVIAVVTAGMLAVSGTAAAGSRAGLVLGPVAVTGPSPVPNCTAGQGPAGSVVFAGAEVEPWLSVNPRNPRNIIGFSQQDRWSNGGARALTFSVTHDGGRHWKEVLFPGVGQCTGGTYQRISDPGVSFAPDGTAYSIALAASFSADNTSLQFSGIFVSTSRDGGDTWSRPIALKEDADPAFFNDKELITADPTDSRRAYAVWDRTNEQGGQPVWFSRTVDGGRTWSPARIIYDPTPGFTIANQIAVLPDGTLLNMFFEGPAGANEEQGIRQGPAASLDEARERVSRRARQQADETVIRVIRSTDHGRTWSPPITVSADVPAEIVDPDEGRPLRTGDIVPDIAVDQRSGRVYIVWQDASATRSQAAVLLSSSGDGGRRWTAPVRVNRTPDSAAQGNGQAFTPAVDVSGDGTVGVTYYDFRNNTAASGVPTDYWIATCRGAGCLRSTVRWRERHVGGPFDVTLAPTAPGFFLGDYMGLDHAGPVFVSNFSMTRPIAGNAQDEFVAGILP